MAGNRNNPRLPTFLIAGAAKCGSSTLYEALAVHPDVYMCPEKEPSYFSKHYADRDLEWYRHLFAESGGETAIGEATVEYLVDPAAAGRIAATLPQVRLIFVLRNPVDRAWSHYWHRIKSGVERRPYQQVIASAGEDEYFIRYGLYARQLRRYLDHFDRDRMRILVLEEIAHDLAPTLADLETFLGIEPSSSGPLSLRSNAAATPRSLAISRAMARVRQWDRLKEALPESAYRVFRKGFRFANRLNLKQQPNPPMPDPIRDRLAEFFRPHIDDLETLLDRPIDAWRQDRRAQ